MSADEARRARLQERRARLSAEQQAQLAQRVAEAPATAAAMALDAAPPGCLVGIHPAGSRRPFFCVHPAGGDVLCYVALAQHLHPQQPLYAFQSPGLHAGEAPLTSLAALADRYVAELRTRQARGPYLLGGWSLGGAVAFEMAQRLEREGDGVPLLAIFDTLPGGAYLSAAERLGAEAFEDNARWLLAIATYVERLWGRALAVTQADLAPLAPEAQMQHFLEQLKRAGLLRSEATLGQLRRLVEVLKANSRAWSLHAPQPGRTRLTLFKAQEQPAGEAGADETMGWGALSPEPVEIRVVPGDHISMLAEPHVRVLAQHVQECLERAQTGAP